MKTVVIQWSSDVSFAERARIEQIVNAWEDFAYGQEVLEDAQYAICDILRELDIDYRLEDSEDI